MNLKKKRLNILKKYKNFKFKKIDISNKKNLTKFLKNKKFDYVFHFAAQAGVRYTFENPYKYIAKSSIYISTSDWEEPGHAILEAGYLNIPIITSDCPNGPKELYRNKINAIVFKTKNLDDLKLKIKEFENLNPSELNNMKKEMKKLTRNFSSYQFNSKISLVLKKLN